MNWLARHRITLSLAALGAIAAWCLWAAPLYSPIRVKRFMSLVCHTTGEGCREALDPGVSLYDEIDAASAGLEIARESENAVLAAEYLSQLRAAEALVTQNKKQTPKSDLLALGGGVLAHLLLAVLIAKAMSSGLGKVAAWLPIDATHGFRLPRLREKFLRRILDMTREHWPRERIDHFVDEYVKTIPRGEAEAYQRSGSELANLYAESIEGLRQWRPGAWLRLGKSVFHLGKLCETAQGRHEACCLGELYKVVRGVIWLDTLRIGGRRLLGLLTFLVAYWGIGQIGIAVLGDQPGILGGIVGEPAPGLFNGYGPSPFSAVLAGTLVTASGVLVVRHLFQPLVRASVEKTRSELDDVLTTALTGPALACVVAAGISMGLTLLPAYIRFALHSGWGAATAAGLPITLTAVLGTWVAVVLFDRVAMHALDRWAKATEQQFDDMFAKLLRVFGSFIIVALVGALLLVKYQSQITAVTGIDNVLLPYSIVVSVLTAILGYSAREGVEVFFGSFLLQVDKPFEIGERLMLESGEVCDVRQVGIRTTVLHNVLDNTEISIPNRTLIRQKVTNISRPDRELRIHVVVQLPTDAILLKRAEGILLDIAYAEVEIDQICLADKEVPPAQGSRRRETITTHLRNLQKVYSHVQGCKAHRILGLGKEISVRVIPKLLLLLAELRRLRTGYAEAVKGIEDLIREALAKSTGDLDVFCRDRLHELDPEEHGRFEQLGSDERLDQIHFFQADMVSAWTSLVRELASAYGHLRFVGAPSRWESVIAEVGGYEISRIARHGIEVELFVRDLSELIRGDPTEMESVSEGEKAMQVQRITGWLERGDRTRYGILLDIAERINEVSELVYVIGDSDRQIRNSRSMDYLASELGKEPLVRSRFGITEEGRSYMEIELAVYSTHLERKYEVTHKLHKEIQRRFRQEGVEAKFVSR